jgi:peptide/nickel transport system substrate-binding protein
MRARALLLAAAAAGCRMSAPPPAPSPPPPLRIGLAVSPASLDPHEINEFITFSVLSNTYEALVTFDRLLGVRPALAESWSCPDDRTWRFRLRPRVTFHDGQPLRARDVVFSFERARGLPAGQFKSYLSSVESVRALSDSEVEVRTRAPNALLLARLAFVLVVPSGSPAQIQAPVGTGPYRLHPWAGGSLITLSAFERHWAGPPTVREAELRVVRGPGRGRQLASGSVDLLQGLSPEDALALAGVHGVRVVSAPGPAVEVLTLNVRRRPLSDPRVRRALSLALDRGGLVHRILRGYGAPTGQLVSRNVFGFDPDLPPPVRDLPEARRLLAAAGYRDGLDLELEYRSGRDAAEIVAQLAEAGVRAHAVSRHWHELLDRIRKGVTQAAFVSVVTDSGEAGDLFESTLHTRNRALGLGDSNDMGYSNRTLDRLIEGLGHTTDLDSRRAVLHRCMRLAVDDLPLVPLYEGSLMWGLRDGVAWEPRADGRILAQEIARR